MASRRRYGEREFSAGKNHQEFPPVRPFQASSYIPGKGEKIRKFLYPNTGSVPLDDVSVLANDANIGEDSSGEPCTLGNSPYLCLTKNNAAVRRDESCFATNLSIASSGPFELLGGSYSHRCHEIDYTDVHTEGIQGDTFEAPAEEQDFHITVYNDDDKEDVESESEDLDEEIIYRRSSVPVITTSVASENIFARQYINYTGSNRTYNPDTVYYELQSEESISPTELQETDSQYYLSQEESNVCVSHSTVEDPHTHELDEDRSEPCDTCLMRAEQLREVIFRKCRGTECSLFEHSQAEHESGDYYIEDTDRKDETAQYAVSASQKSSLQVIYTSSGFKDGVWADSSMCNSDMVCENCGSCLKNRTKSNVSISTELEAVSVCDEACNTNPRSNYCEEKGPTMEDKSVGTSPRDWTHSEDVRDDSGYLYKNRKRSGLIYENDERSSLKNEDFAWYDPDQADGLMEADEVVEEWEGPEDDSYEKGDNHGRTSPRKEDSGWYDPDQVDDLVEEDEKVEEWEGPVDGDYGKTSPRVDDHGRTSHRVDNQKSTSPNNENSGRTSPWGKDLGDTRPKDGDSERTSPREKSSEQKGPAVGGRGFPSHLVRFRENSLLSDISPEENDSKDAHSQLSSGHEQRKVTSARNENSEGTSPRAHNQERTSPVGWISKGGKFKHRYDEACSRCDNIREETGVKGHFHRQPSPKERNREKGSASSDTDDVALFGRKGKTNLSRFNPRKVTKSLVHKEPNLCSTRIHDREQIVRSWIQCFESDPSMCMVDEDDEGPIRDEEAKEKIKGCMNWIRRWTEKRREMKRQAHVCFSTPEASGLGRIK